MDYYEEDYYDEADVTVVESKTLSLEDLKYTQNDEAFDNLLNTIFLNQKAILHFQIEDGVAIYKLESQNDLIKKIFLNKEIAQAVYEVLKNGKLTATVKDWFAVDKNADEDYMLRLIKSHRQDGTIRYRQRTGEIVAVYPHGEINYGKLTYSLDELKEKLNTLV
ncbi:hypothetical protein LJC45_03170 [Alistipes sp. OttesenSCG-928-B03]|nr:hypothetical protein [Alistipes sp. OttesenSCG-928-B03]